MFRLTGVTRGRAGVPSRRARAGIMQRLAQSTPGDASRQHDLSVALSKVGNVQRAQGDIAGALKSYRDSLRIRSQLARSNLAMPVGSTILRCHCS